MSRDESRPGNGPPRSGARDRSRSRSRERSERRQEVYDDYPPRHRVGYDRGRLLSVERREGPQVHRREEEVAVPPARAAPPTYLTGSNRQPLGTTAAPAVGGGTGPGGGGEEAYTGPVERPNFGLSGALAKDTQTGNVRNGQELKYVEPREAAVPTAAQRWRLFVFKDGEAVPGVEGELSLHASSAYLFGRDAKVADVPMAHPSISGQHAVLQYRRVPVKQGAGDMEPARMVVKPYVLDLDSTNGTFLNGTRLDGARYVELKAKDVLRFGSSSREYVLLQELA